MGNGTYCSLFANYLLQRSLLFFNLEVHHLLGDPQSPLADSADIGPVSTLQPGEQMKAIYINFEGVLPGKLHQLIFPGVQVDIAVEPARRDYQMGRRLARYHIDWNEFLQIGEQHLPQLVEFGEEGVA